MFHNFFGLKRGYVFLVEMTDGDLKFVLFSIGMGATIASSLVSIYILVVSLTGRASLVFESNPFLTVFEILLLIFGIGTCVVATEVYQRYQQRSRLQAEAVKKQGS